MRQNEIILGDCREGQLSLFEVPAPDAIARRRLDFRPANMRTVHGIRHENRHIQSYSVSCVECVEDRLLDESFVRISGAGMDAPDDLPIGSVKACFSDIGYPTYRLTGIIQRTYRRDKA
ncbi:hypothetical protein [Pandoraea apista]|uniref:Uncharacterized protein n=2 Tax=Pandoraea apista TaxID=93218 RepID=A0ABX9ZHZ8_9BURK|nr:hypothetical protein [Pandoraea apista]PTE02674.1 hypothetical protein C7830_00150 [Pandoraea apista]RRJ27543.1 hypothetical protein EIB05_21525 [Pandoraea apista]RRJ73166.1 hypothetical protein EIL82_22040 [Pandoraea apista]RSD06477.1 hypothetical protein EJB12_21630 [Pandoraea apista]RSD11280.1 hypothetical protein EIZ52_21515 [Pandoraea apista]